MYAPISDHGSGGPAVEDVKFKTRAHSTKSVVNVKSEPSTPPASGSLKFSLTPPDKKDEVKLTAEQLKKCRRNERDRRRNCAKRETMEQMRKAVAVLELQKQQIMQHFTDNSSCSSPGNKCRSPSSCPDLVVSTLYPSTSTQVTRDDYVQLATEIEEFRRQNAAMTQMLARRDLFSNSLRYRLSSFPRLDSLRGILSTQLTHNEGMIFVRQTMKRIHDARRLYQCEKCFQNRPTCLGWSQYHESRGDVVTFRVKKELRNVTPQQLMDRTWELQTNGDKLRRLGPSHVQTHIIVLQKITNDVMVIDRRTEDQSQTNQSGRPLVLRTMHVLFRVVDNDDTQTMCIKTLDTPVADRMLRNDEVWWDIFYWIRVSPSDPTTCNNQEVTIITEFGGVNSCMRKNLTASRLKELVFFAIRWETAVVAPFLLKQ